ncbi:MAG: uroporphyrinogen-III decarboxylase-like protein [Anaerolineae bacterium]|nr:uroporphyrinogen-III decarboxylase-like protein [Anaerolineae bacterium]NUQ04990.1 uroporphyrinogen-III decarboxylase-like protein [Anaerolineae bacterium]
MSVLTPRERWFAVLNRQPPDRLPMDYWGTPEATERLKRHLGCATEWQVFERLHIDRMVQVKPRYVGPPLKPGYDIWGLRYEDVDYGTGVYAECVENPLANYSSIEEIEANYVWAQADWFDYSGLPDQITGKEIYPVQGGGSEPFLIYKDLRGHEQAYMDLVLNPELVAHCLDRLFAFAYENTTRIYETLPGRVDFSYIAEDFGGQERLLFSPAIIREVFLPRMKRMMDLAHQNGTRVFFHSDGAIHDILPDLIAIGIDILNPIQWRCAGMDRGKLKREFGDQVIFHGGVDNQQTLAFGTVDAVIGEVRDNIDILGAGGGYILAPCHNIQAVSPPANIVAMYQTGYEYGRL